MSFVGILLLVTIASAAQGYRVCPKGWVYYRNRCYLFSEEKATVKEAMKGCANAASNGRLVQVHNAQEEAWLEQQLKLRAMSRVWMGMSDIMEETVFLKLTDARKIAFTNWNDNEPNNHRGIEDCVEWVSNGKWNDAPCDVKRQFVCEMP
ncbi:low affinity immunoglobulin epsilon Fc receptor-like [Ostrea edulis]|uniref:low affinity immunoglobulin epsilon Fc receptor-like n=1 Tax=Ostrea edulis TaxID=37623 RepID=UPI002094CA8E|nr:low affinity immunoglobulin epsilon Fc receptor-like [Ostrea edulis]